MKSSESPMPALDQKTTTQIRASHLAAPSGGVLPQSQTLRRAILLLLALPALVSLVYAIRGALTGGLDFQWSGAHLLVMRQDPWLTFLSGDPQHQIVLGQNPNYLAELYLLLYPLGAMTLAHALAVWCVVNLLLLAGCLFLACRLFQLDRDHALLLVLATLISTPFRATMLNGQASLFILLMLSLLYAARGVLARGAALGLSYSKYSFSPLLVLTQLLKGRWRIFLVSAVPPLVGLLVVRLLLHESLLQLALEPLKTSRLAMAPGWGDLMTTLEKLMAAFGAAPSAIYLVPVAAGLTASVLAALFIARLRNLAPAAELALALAFTLLCLQHLIYDYVALMVPIAALLALPRSPLRAIALWCAAYIWIGASVLHRLAASQNLLASVVNFAVILAFTFSLARLFGSRQLLSGPR